MHKNRIHSSRKLAAQFLLGLIALFFVQCSASPAPKKKVVQKKIQVELIPPEVSITYHLICTKDSNDWLRALQPGDTLTALLAVNRVDRTNLMYLDTLVIPDSIGIGINMYSPFPKKVDNLQNVHKIMFISQYAQAFAVYENGVRIRWGPTSTGKKYTTTPNGLFATNWKSKKTYSTVNPSWILEWYFNLANLDGVGMHQYALPGYPASHGCVRLYQRDAYWLYHWADQWVVEDGKIAVYGSPVVIFDPYPFGERKPWRLLAEDLDAIKITPAKLSAAMKDFLPTVAERQEKRDSLVQKELLTSR